MEVVGTRENGWARGRRSCLLLECSFFLAPTNSKRPLRGLISSGFVKCKVIKNFVLPRFFLPRTLFNLHLIAAHIRVFMIRVTKGLVPIGPSAYCTLNLVCYSNNFSADDT